MTAISYLIAVVVAHPAAEIQRPAAPGRHPFSYVSHYVFREPDGPAAKVLFADHGADFKPINISPEDSQLLESRRFTVEELARLYAVPGPVIGDNSHSTFTNSETLLRFWAMGTLNTWATKFAAEASRSIFGSNSDYELVLDLSGLLKGDPATRWATHKIAIDAGILDPDEVRLEEGWNKRGRGAPNAAAEDNGAGAETVRI